MYYIIVQDVCHINQLVWTFAESFEAALSLMTLAKCVFHKANILIKEW